MTRKDYKKIAEVIDNFRASSVENNNPVRIGHVLNLTEMFSLMLKRDNARFDTARFRAACGVPDTTSEA